MKQNENKTAIHLKVTHAYKTNANPKINIVMSENIGQRRLIFFQQEISSHINKLTWKEIKRTSEEMPENKLLFPF